jgi:hypothetical protein
LAYQSWYIASGRAVSPPSTVTHFPSAVGYWLVQVIILVPALGVAGLLARRTASGPDPRGLARRTQLASALGLAASVIIILFGFVWFRPQGGTVYVAHHSSGGSPPLIGMLGLLAEFVTFAGLGLIAFRRRRTARVAHPVRSGQAAAASDLAERPGPRRSAGV